MRSVRWRLMFSVLILTIPLRSNAKTVALIINFGDLPGSEMHSLMEKGASNAVRVYKKLGYEVLRVDPGPDLRARIERGLSKIKGADQISVLTYGHGENVRSTARAPAFPRQNLIPSSLYGPWAVGTYIFKKGEAATMPELDFGRPVDTDAYGFGVGDFENWIRSVRKENPHVRFTFNMQQCYSGMAARWLNQIDGVKAYSSTSDREMAHLKQIDGKKVSFQDFFVNEIAKSAGKVPRPGDDEVFERARRAWVGIPQLKGVEYAADIPWSPVDTHIVSWCAENPMEQKKNTEALDTSEEVVKRQSELTLSYEKERSQSRRQIAGCLKGDFTRSVQDALVKSKALLKPAVARAIARADAMGYTEFASRKPNFIEAHKEIDESRFADFKKEIVGELQSVEKCFPKCQAALVYLSTLFQVASDITYQTTPKACRTWEADQQADCLEWIGENQNKYPVFAVSRLLAIARIVRQFEDICADRRREQQYGDCYRKFWEQADSSSRRTLVTKTQAGSQPATVSNPSRGIQ